MSDIVYVDTADALAALCQRLRGAEWLALDTEFIRKSTYYPKLCLIQLASAELVACIDPLALGELGPLFEVLYDARIVKVLHAAHQDLEIFYHLRGQVPCPVFDTQLAAAMLAHGEQIGYANLVKALLDIDIDKSQARTDWARRPLEPAQLVYAADDVRHLREIYQRQRQALEEAGQYAAFVEAGASLCDPGRYRPQPEQAWMRVRGGNRLHGAKLAVVQALAAWREREAMRLDRPRQWILGDHALLLLAYRLPRTAEALAKLRALPPRTLERYGAAWLELIAAASL